MKIDSQNVLTSINLYQKDPVVIRGDAAQQADRNRAYGTDRVELSTRKGEIEKLKNTANAMPDVRPEKVAAMKQRMAGDSYRVDPALVAGKMLENWKDFKNSGVTQ